MVAAIVASFGTKLTITTRRTIHREPNSTVEILHADLGDVSITKDSFSSPGDLSPSTLTIETTQAGGKNIVLRGTGHGEHVKKMLEGIKQQLRPPGASSGA